MQTLARNHRTSYVRCQPKPFQQLAPLPEGWARGIAIDDRRRPTRTSSTICAQVHTVEVTRRGQLRVHRVDVAFEEGFSFVNPLMVRKQIEGQGHGRAAARELEAVEHPAQLCA